MAAERLQKLLAGRGLASRREAEAWILAGRVRVNGQVVAELGARADPAVDRVEVDGRPLPPERRPLTLVLHKPKGYVTTVKDPHAERTVMELLEGVDRRVYPVGRLDVDTRGVLLLTDDGDLARALMHPSTGLVKVYLAKVRGTPDPAALRALRAGIAVESRKAIATTAEIARKAANSWVRIAVTEGRKHLVRRMLQAVGHPVEKLRRVSFGPIELGSLAVGSYRVLDPEEVAALRAAAKIGSRGTHRAPSRKGPESS
jgi:pseudouridine synthase